MWLYTSICLDASVSNLALLGFLHLYKVLLVAYVFPRPRTFARICFVFFKFVLLQFDGGVFVFGCFLMITTRWNTAQRVRFAFLLFTLGPVRQV